MTQEDEKKIKEEFITKKQFKFIKEELPDGLEGIADYFISIMKEREAKLIGEIEKNVSFAECECPGEGASSREYYYHLTRGQYHYLISLIKNE